MFKNPASSNFIIRAISGIGIISIINYSILSSFYIFAFVFFIIFSLMMKEWYEITKSNIVDVLIGFGVILLAFSSLLLVKILENSENIILWYFATIWSFDSFAMIGGKYIGGKKLAEKISPNKTWSGVMCGLYTAILINNLIFEYNNFESFELFKIFAGGFVIPTSIICIIAHIGDLFESFYKRKYAVKDSGSLIPGHGGVLDRFDSLIFSAPILLFIIII